MDRTFWSADVFRYLPRARYPVLIPVAARGKKAGPGGGPGGTRAFFHRPSGRYAYRVANRRQQTAAVTILVPRRNHAGRDGKHGRYAWAYALWRVDRSTARSAQQSSRRRFRIESSYRLLESGRRRTSSREEGLRLWYVVLAILLVNGWLTLRREASRRWGPGEAGRCGCLELLTVLAQVLREAAANAAGPANTQPLVPQSVPGVGTPGYRRPPLRSYTTPRIRAPTPLAGLFSLNHGPHRSINGCRPWYRSR